MPAHRMLVHLCLAGLMIPSVAGAVHAAEGLTPSPVRALGPHPSLGGVLRVDLDGAALNRLREFEHATIEAFPLSVERTIDLDVSRIEIFAPGASIVVERPDGPEAIERPDVVLLGGYVVGRPDSRVFLGLSPLGSNGIIMVDGSTWVLSSGPAGDGLDTIIYELGSLPEGAISWKPFHCALDELREAAGLPDADFRERDARGVGDVQCRVADVAVETDWEFTGDLFGGNTTLSAAYATELIGAVSEIYTRDVDVRLRISWLRVWSDSSDPWDADNTIDQLYEFRDYWEENMAFVPRHVAHFLSGRALGGGVAWFPGVCNGPYAYGLSANINGYFPYPLQDNHPQNWDPYVVAHEFGHNFGAPHTHDHVPQIDDCAGGDCIPDGTIMSYCHTCDGGMTNIVLVFHPMIQDDMLAFMDFEMGCNIDVAPVVISVPPEDQAVCAGGPVLFQVIALGEPPITYQWRKDGIDIPGANASSYLIEDVTPDDAGTYDVLVTNPCGEEISDPAMLTVLTGDGADVDCDGDVDINDLLQLLAAWGPCSGCPEDLNGDGQVDIIDLLYLLANWS